MRVPNFLNEWVFAGKNEILTFYIQFVSMRKLIIRLTSTTISLATNYMNIVQTTISPLIRRVDFIWMESLLLFGGTDADTVAGVPPAISKKLSESVIKLFRFSIDGLKLFILKILKKIVLMIFKNYGLLVPRFKILETTAAFALFMLFILPVRVPSPMPNSWLNESYNIFSLIRNRMVF